MRVLITGGAGFLGSALARRLAADGHHVRVLDDLSAGDPSRLPPEVLFTRGDVRDRPKLWTVLQGVQCVFHLAARVSVPESVAYPREYNDVNVGGTVALMEAMRDVGVRRVVLASSGTVYGNQPKQPVDEDMRPNPLAPYAVSKIAAEHYVFTLGALYGIETVALRIFNAYGPGQPLPPVHAPVIPQFLKQTLSGGSLVVFGDGMQTRDFVYVDDVVDALIAAATAPGVDRQIINVGSGEEVSINSLIRTIAEVTGRHPSVLYNEKESGGVSRLVADLRKARALLGYEPKVDLRTGLQRFLAEDGRFRSKAAQHA
ncbi:MAG TPA: NAD-dependent epimerase/dehydratase family protein [Caldilineae bacterium]|nr:NAD-dependent epimerase/dehydratase family protein [Caldilineae bacterium]